MVRRVAKVWISISLVGKKSSSKAGWIPTELVAALRCRQPTMVYLTGWRINKGCDMARGNTHLNRGFTLLEIMAVVLIMLVMTTVAAVSLANSRTSVKAKKDAAQMVAFLRNSWDHAKATGAPLILAINFKTGAFSYTDPRSGKKAKAKFSSEAHVLAVQLNDRLYTARNQVFDEESEQEVEEGTEEGITYLYLSEGRGLTHIAVLFGVLEDEIEQTYDYLNLASLNLINGRGEIRPLEMEDLELVLEHSVEQLDEQNP